MIFDKPQQHLTVSELFQWLNARQVKLQTRAKHLWYEDSKALDQRELMQVQELQQGLANLADACRMGYLPFSIEDYVNDFDDDYRRHHPVQHALLEEELGSVPVSR